MCGIVYFNYKNGQSVNRMVKKAYKKQRSRGTRGFGFFTPNNNRLTHNTDERGILRLLNRTRQSEILFHHRFPTSTDNTRNACHPFSTKDVFDYNYVMVHNGVIANDLDVARLQQANGIKYISTQKDGSFNDSEVLLYDLANVLEGRQEFLTVRGSIAFIVVQLDKNGNKVALYYGRNAGSPLVKQDYPHGFSLTSEGNGKLIDSNTLFRYDYATKQTTSSYMYIPEYSYRGYYDTAPSDDDYYADKWYASYCKEKERKYVLDTEEALDNHKYIDLFEYDDKRFGYLRACSDVKSALLRDGCGVTSEAIELAELLLENIKIEYEKIEFKLENDGELNSKELDNLTGYDAQIRLLDTCITQLKHDNMQLALIGDIYENNPRKDV